MATKATVKYENPVITTSGNLLLTTLGDVWAYYKVKPFQLNVANAEDKNTYFSYFVDALERLQKYEDVSFTVLPADMDLEGRIKGTAPDWATDLGNIPEYYLGQEQLGILNSEFKPAVIDEFYIGVKLKNTNFDDTVRDKLKQTSDFFIRRVAETLRFQIQYNDEFFKRYEVMNDDVLGILMTLNAEKVTPKQLATVLGYSYRPDDESSLESMRETVFDLATAGTIKRITDKKTDYMSQLVLLLPDTWNEDFDLIPELLSFKFPVMIDIKVNFPKRTGLTGITQKTKSAMSKYRDELVDSMESGNDNSTKKSETNYLMAKDLGDVLEGTDAFMSWSLVLTITDDTVDGLKDKIRRVKTRLNTFDRKIKVIKPLFSQELLLYQALPATNLGLYQRWLQYTQAEALATLMFGTSYDLGTNTGFYIGRVLDDNKYSNLVNAIYSSRRLLLLNPVIANKGISGAKTDSPHIAVTGDMGQGKSFLVKLLLLNLSMFNAKVLYLDPKQEVRRWFERALNNSDIPAFKKLISSFNFVTLNANDSNNNGVLDPLLTLNAQSSPDEKPAVMTLVKEMLLQVRSIGDNLKLDLALNEAISRVIDRRLMGENVGSLVILDELESGEAVDLARAYRSTIQDSMLRLAFSDGQNEGLSITDRRTILEVTGLEFPAAEQEAKTYTETQKYSMSIMLALGKYLEKFGRQNTAEFSIEMIDEAWIFTASNAGKKVLDAIKRLGRSENNMLVYSTQRVGDVSGADSQGQFGQLFAFDSSDDRENILLQFGLPVNKENLQMLKDMSKGQALFRDIYGRVGKVAIHSLFDEWTEAFKTVDKNTGALLEAQYG